mmetsp:Transcript_31560/g.92526  ORF Transcript_31560/g.92526 Transcript_31560/m.92526 type:complete len:625 (+) Transcript_31560:289-2163(+)
MPSARRGQQADDETQGAEQAQGQQMQQAPAGVAAGAGWGLPIPPGANLPMPNQMPPPPAGAMPPLPTFPGQFNAPQQPQPQPQPQGLQQQQIWAAQQAAALAAARPLQMPHQQVLSGMPPAAAAQQPDGGNPQGFVAQLYVCPQCHKGLKSQAGLTSHLQHCKPEKIHAEMMRNPQEKLLRISTKRREKWELRYAELVEYKRKHRHCKVPANDPENLQLGRWVSATRREYKKRQSGQKNQLTDERVLKLHGIGFEFDVHTTNWEQKYEELCDFQEKHGHCNVPSTFKENQPLSIWVKRQREAHYKRFKHGKKVGMSDERITALTSIGFDFSDYTPVPRGKQVNWDERIQQLQAYKDTHGDCNVPRGKFGATDEEESLGNWVALCRNNYTKNVKTLTEEKKQQLEDMGFVWRMKGRDMTAEEKAQRKKERAEIELRRQVNREVRKRKLVPAEDAEKKTPKKKAKTSTSKKAATDTTTKVSKSKGKAKTKGSAKPAAAGTKPPRTYFGHVPKPSEDGGAPPLPELPPGGWDTSDRKTRIEAARRAADYYSRMAQKWEAIAQEEEEAESEELVQAAAAAAELPDLGEAEVEVEAEEEANAGSCGEKNEYASASEGYAADESEAVEAI